MRLRHLLCDRSIELDDRAVKEIEQIEQDYFITSDHEMTKDHYLSFTALLTGDTLFLRRQYPEWDFQTRIPRFGHGLLLWYCTRHGLFWQEV